MLSSVCFFVFGVLFGDKDIFVNRKVWLFKGLFCGINFLINTLLETSEFSCGGIGPVLTALAESLEGGLISEGINGEWTLFVIGLIGIFEAFALFIIGCNLFPVKYLEFSGIIWSSGVKFFLINVFFYFFYIYFD